MNFRKRTRSRKNSINYIVNTEKWRKSGKRMSYRETNYSDESSVEDEPKTKEIKDWVEEFFERKSVNAVKSDQDIEVHLTKKQTLILSTLVPDEIINTENFNCTDPKRFVGVLLMADVSGYTALSERYNNSGKGGTYRLTVTLNTYLGSLIELIYAHGGDIIKFAGDAFLALWKTDKRTFLYHTIHTVTACALIIQHLYASYETDVKVNLKVKLAISAGNLIFAPIGAGIDMSYIIIGLPVIEAKIAESVCASGEVKLTPTAWGHCYSRNYDHIVHEDGYVTIKSILYDPREKDITKPFQGFGNKIRQIKKPFGNIEGLPDFLWDSPKILSPGDQLKKKELLSLRKAIFIAEEKNIGSEIRKFMIRPVLTQIDAHQPLEYLTEMRQVSVLFITLKPRECPFPQLITIVNNAYQITCEIVYKSMGCVNKIILFDKDIMILVIFGLRGFKHESDAQVALKCAYSIKKSVSTLDGVLEVSIGVTTGQVYCGVVGHPLRREFTVIGAIVNKAARLMCNFRNKITCDETTFIKSKMSSNGFTLQPKTELKGIVQPGKIFEYTEEIRVKELHNIPMIPPLLNRIDEMEYFENWLDDCHLSYRDFDALLLIGESRIGKSRLIEWMARYARNKKFHVSYVNLTSIHSATPYLALSQIINQMLNLTEPLTGFIKEEKIVELLQVYSDDLCYLNNIIKVRFAYHEGIYSMNDEKRKERAKQIFCKLVSAFPDVHVLVLDDLNNLDSSSWEFISLMFKVQNFFTVLSVTRGKFTSMHSWLYNVFVNSNVRKIVLGSLSSTMIPALACQILDVDAVPNDLCNALRTKCKGMPGLVESFIVHLFSSGALELKKIQDDELENWKNEDLQFPDPELLRPQALNSEDQAALDQYILQNSAGEISICIVTKKEELKTNINDQSLDALIMIQIDTLTPYQQLLLKIASVIGNVCSRNLLENIMYENNSLTTAKAVKRLFAMRILTCANVKYTWSRRNISTVTLTSNKSLAENLTCECSFEHISEENEGLPKYAFCKVMKFKNKNSRKTCYELLPINQKKEFHSRIVSYLENNKQKCPNCGGTIMVVQSTIDFLSSVESDYDLHILDEDSEESQSDTEHEVDKIEMLENSVLINDQNRASNSRQQPRNNSPTNSVSSIKMLHAPILKYVDDETDDLAFRRRSTKRVTMSSLVYKDTSPEENNKYNISDILRVITEKNKLSDWHNLGITDSKDDILNNRKSFTIKIENNVSQTDLSKCTCSELNIMIYEQLIHHAKHADLKIKVIEFLIKFSYLNLISDNLDSVLEKLEEAENSCTRKQSQESIPAFNRKRFLGQIYSLRAATLLISGNVTGAKMELDRAIKIYHINLLKITEFFKLKSIITAIKLNRQKYRIHETAMQCDSVFCLNVATSLYSALGDDTVSRISAFRALNIVQRVECNFVDMCDTFTNAIQVEFERGALESTAEIEQIAHRALSLISRPIYSEELYALGKLFVTCFKARMSRAELPSSIRSGFRAITISRYLYADKVSLDIIPDLFYLLLARRRINEAVDVAKMTLQLSEMSHYDCITWYHALCMDLILDAGFQVQSPYEINRFAEVALERNNSSGPARRRLVVSLWTYWLRADLDKKAKKFESEALDWAGYQDDDGSLTTLISAIRLAEGMLESLARKVDDLRKVVDLMELRSIADRELNRLEKDARFLKAIYPRWLLLKGNSLKLSGRVTSATVTFNQALEEARKCYNYLEEAAALSVTSNSRLWVEKARLGQFIPWQEGIEKARTSWHKLLYNTSTTRQ